MKILKINTFLDGGTQEIFLEEKTIYKDGRRNSQTKGMFYTSHPRNKDSKILNLSKDIIDELNNNIKNFTNNN